MLSSGSAAIGVSALASTAYGNERTEVIEYANEGGCFHADYKKHDDLKQMLDSNKDSLKLEAMKRIIGMIAKGRDASDLFPAVVKNVVSKNIEVKKLVYVYLVRYAEEQQDLALLSISTFQRALKDPNQLIRASALRVLSSIRVSMIVPIVMLAIRDSASDMSPYVRKTAAHAIPKLYSLDPEQKDELIVVIEKLLADRTTLVVGSAVMAFEEVCPERTELIHKNYRKLCNLLADVDEWGQVLIINMLTRYARTQFLDPNADDDVDVRDAENKPFYEDESDSDASDGKRKDDSIASPRKTYTLDVDHRMLLRQTKPLLQSRNASVVMAVAQLYHHVAPRNEVEIVAKALIRLLRSYKEVQSVVLTCIASMSIERKSIFEPFLKSFFVRTSDQTHIKLLKLEILTNLATATNISVILREFQTYISSNDKEFVASTIQAIGRCAVSISEVTETCLSGLVHLLSNKDEYVVAESVVVIKKLLHTQKEEHFEIISQMAKLLDFIQVPAARAAILWLIGEYNEKVPKIAPDVLRKAVKSFIDEQDIVKLQVLNLAVKLHITNPAQTALLCQHLHNLARYDSNYDIRDRARFLKPFLLAASNNNNGNNGMNGGSILLTHARKIFLSEKAAPTLESKYHGRRQYQLGSLSHYLNMPTNGYQDLPAWPLEAPDNTVRHVEPPAPLGGTGSAEYPGTGRGGGGGGDRRKKKSKSFYSGSEDASSTTTEGASSGSDSSSGSGSGSNSSSGSGSESSGSGSSSSGSGSSGSSGSGTSESEESSGHSSSASDNEESGTQKGVRKSRNSSSAKSSQKAEERFSKSAYNEVEGTSQSKQETSTEDSDSDSSGSYESSSSSSASVAKKNATKAQASKQTKPIKDNPKPAVNAAPVKSNLDLLLDLDDIPPIGPVMTPSLGGFLTPLDQAAGGLAGADGGTSIELVGPSFIPTKKRELLNKVNGFGLGIEYRFVRAPHLFSARMVSVELTFTNHGNVELLDIAVGRKANLPAGVAVHDFAPIGRLDPSQTTTGMLGVDFNDSTQPIPFEIRSGSGTSQVTLKAPVGEMVRSVAIAEGAFDSERAKLRGMTEHSCTLTLGESFSPDNKSLHRAVFEATNVASVVTSDSQRLLFAGQTMNSKSLVLIVFERKESAAVGGNDYSLTVNCEKLVVGSMLMNELKAALKK
ncbi:AP-3 complex subunit beta-2 [Anopheles ziemanni]|uniref:AP-3 complex subunit beta-2 n=1 Tax=Anopheles coustani TaxID=139045 RepID=UPI002658A728|nr:AP-3 complex subunit beta-2 [Anopheles coustani]XP_058174950.1 AP-3 complex subunit beta-2 [Anopheles ziemanni]